MTELPPPSDDILSVGGRFYVRVTGALADENDRVLKQGESFVVVDRHGDVLPLGLAEEGVYHNGTRHLSQLVLRIGDERPLLLGSTARSNNSRLAVDLTNGDISGADGRPIPRSTVHLARSKVLLDGVCYEHIVARNFGEDPVHLPVRLRFGADFADIFEVRGTRRTLSGDHEEPVVGEAPASVCLGYVGADGVRRATRLLFDPAPDALTSEQADWSFVLPPDEPLELNLAIACDTDGSTATPIGFRDAVRRAARDIEGALGPVPTISASNERFLDLVRRSTADLGLMVTRAETGPFPYAGVPWFSTPFGRDALVVGLQTVWLAPELAIGVLRFLAMTQADAHDPVQDAQPGKILHEMRQGEMAATGEIPFARYYGSHDATPLFIMLLHRTWRRTGDLGLVRELWPNVERALQWIEFDADPDGDGFAEYQRATDDGLLHQGWKDSNDSISHADGALARGPIALVEVQAYCYAAWRGAADLAAALGDDEARARLTAHADDLRERFEPAFWDEELGTYVLALDGDKRPCRVVASNAGHVLFSGIADPDRARRVAATLVHERSFSGWGIRTLAAGERRYNPMSYHNGSIWPHDTAIVAAGLARYGHHDEAAALLRAMTEASLEFDLLRVPELFCGFSRRTGEGPTRYPVACAPQSWAAGSVFMMLQACLGLDADAVERRVTVGPGRLPADIETVRIEDLRVADAAVDLEITNQGAGLGVEVVRRRGKLEVIVVK